MAEGLALVLGRWLDRPGWGMVRRRAGSCLAKPRRAIPEPPRLRLETPAGVIVAVPVRLPGETVLACARRTHPGRVDVMLCGADLTPLDPIGSVGATEVLVVVIRQKPYREYAISLIQNNQLAELRWAIAHGCSWHENASYDAAFHGHLELLQWAVANGCRWHEDTSYGAAYGGHLELLQWAIAHGCEWHEATSWYAAYHGGHLELLVWAIANGCPWHKDTSRSAARHGHLELLQWALANSCPLSPTTRDDALEAGYTEIVEWLDAREA